MVVTFQGDLEKSFGGGGPADMSELTNMCSSGVDLIAVGFQLHRKRLGVVRQFAGGSNPKCEHILLGYLPASRSATMLYTSGLNTIPICVAETSTSTSGSPVRHTCQSTKPSFFV